MDGPSALEILWIKENTIHVFWLLLLFWETFFKKPFWQRKKVYLSSNTWGEDSTLFKKHWRFFKYLLWWNNLLNEDHCCSVLFPSSFVISVILFYQLHFFQVPQEVLQNWSKHVVYIFRYSGFSINYLDSNLHFNLGFQDHTNKPLYLVVISCTMSALRIAPYH